MLEKIPDQKNRRRVYRLASPQNSDRMAELDLDDQARDELRELLARRTDRKGLDELCDHPFRAKRKFRRRSRFSDGSFPVFYSSLDASTAQAEMLHWFPWYVGKPRNPRTAYYHRFSCTFEGIEKDLRLKASVWPGLTDSTDYDFCNRIGTEAHNLQIDGLVTPSARYQGSNLPVFRRSAISDPSLEDVVIMTYHPDTGNVSVG